MVAYLEQLQLPQRAINYITSSPPQRLNMLTMGRARELGVEVNAYEADDITGSVDQMPARSMPAIELLPQVDLYGRNLPRMPIEARNADECQAQCAAKQTCVAFTFNTAHFDCFLKSSVEIAANHPAAVSGLRESLTQRIGRKRMTIQEATDYPGNDIVRQKGTTFEACLMSCNKTRACKAFTYVISRQECWFKDAIGLAEPGDGVVSGVK